MKEYLHKVVTMQAAGIGCDFEERLEKSKLDFRWEMLQKIDATIEGISAAIGKGMTQRTKSEQEVEARKGALAETEEKLSKISERLMRIKAAADSA